MILSPPSSARERRCFRSSASRLRIHGRRLLHFIVPSVSLENERKASQERKRLAKISFIHSGRLRSWLASHFIIPKRNLGTS